MAGAVSLIEAAAAGDHAAQAALRDEFLAQADIAADGFSPYAVPACDLLQSAETWARIAAGNPMATRFDQFFLVQVLLMRAGSCRGFDALETYADVLEAIGRNLLDLIIAADRDFIPAAAWLLQGLANAGDDWAALALEQLVDALPANEAAEVAADVADAERELHARQGAPAALDCPPADWLGGVLFDTLPVLRLEKVKPVS